MKRIIAAAACLTLSMTCMGNGKDEAKKYAYHITTNIEDDGIRNGLKFLGLID